MATTIKKGLICTDEALTEGLFPYTSTECVFDENGVPLKDILGLKLDLLWTNANPNVGFPAQTIPLDLSDYDLVYIIYCIATDAGDGLRRYNTCLLNIDGHVYQPNSYFSGSSSGNTRRNITPTATGIEFGAGLYGANTSAPCNVPQSIYGVKADVQDLRNIGG